MIICSRPECQTTAGCKCQAAALKQQAIDEGLFELDALRARIAELEAKITDHNNYREQRIEEEVLRRLKKRKENTKNENSHN